MPIYAKSAVQDGIPKGLIRKSNCLNTKRKRPPKSGLPGDSYRIQTCNLLIRSQMLYSVELTDLL